MRQNYKTGLTDGCIFTVFLLQIKRVTCSSPAWSAADEIKKGLQMQLSAKAWTQSPEPQSRSRGESTACGGCSCRTHTHLLKSLPRWLGLLDVFPLTVQQGFLPRALHLPGTCIARTRVLFPAWALPVSPQGLSLSVPFLRA